MVTVIWHVADTAQGHDVLKPHLLGKLQDRFSRFSLGGTQGL